MLSILFHISYVRKFEQFVPKGSEITKRLLYMNPREDRVHYKVVSNMENVLEIKSGILNLGKDERDYIKF